MTIENDLLHPDSKKERYRLVRVRAAYTAKVDELVAVQTSVGAITVTLPTSPSAGACVAVGDDSTNAATNPITVASAALIDGAASLVFSENDVLAEFIFNGSTWRQLVSSRGIAGVGRDLNVISIADLRRAI